MSFEQFVCRGGGKTPFLNVNQLMNFLNQEQRDPRLNEILYPYYNKEKALSLIWKYEKSLDNLRRGIEVEKMLATYSDNDSFLTLLKGVIASLQITVGHRMIVW